MEDSMSGVVLEMLWCVLILIVVSWVMIRVCDTVWLKPRRIRSTLSKQGIAGPKSSFFYGNVKQMQSMMEESTVTTTNSPSSSSSDVQPPVSHHQWLRSIFPYIQIWARRYGRMYMFSTGMQQHLLVNEAELIKELKLHKSLDLGKPSYLTKALEPMLGNGIIKANGHHWSFQKKLIAPEFFLHKVKGMVGLMEECTMAMISTWERRLSQSNRLGRAAATLDDHEFRVDQDLRGLSADIISRACFGSSYSQGKNIFAKLRDMQEALSHQSLVFGLPYFRFLPTKSNREIWRLKREVEDLILKVVNKGRQEASQKDLLQMILESAATDSELHQDKRKTERFIVDNCKNIYFAGYETTALSASWTLMLLALHPQWQQRVRAEIIENGSLDNMDKLNQLKTLTMVIQESLRLYAPSVMVAREAFADIKLGDFQLPKGVHVWSFIPELHRDPDNWGPDAGEFKPERFAGGISEACKYPQMYIPFGYGTRLCIGQTFAMLELKVVLSLLLSRFSFSLSPNYRHSPVYKMLVMPQHGMRLIVKGV
ncbi:hypothetical protein ACOSQ3_028344 [Xanthoceras sorbifolium]